MLRMVLVVLLAGLLPACGNIARQGSFSIEDPSQFLSAYSAALQAMISSVARAGFTEKKGGMSDAESNCSADAAAINPVTKVGLSEMDPDYAARTWFCRVARDTRSAHSWLGRVGFARQLLCAIQRESIPSDGAVHSKVLTIDPTCFDAATRRDLDVTSLEVAVVATRPAEGNRYFEHSYRITSVHLEDLTLLFRTQGGGMEFAMIEGKEHATVGAWDPALGEIRFESRHDQLNYDGDRFSRHDRMLARTTTQGALVTDIVDLTAAASFVRPTSAGVLGALTTISGDRTRGFKPRYFTANQVGLRLVDVAKVANYIEVASTRCYVSKDRKDASSCGRGVGLPNNDLAFAISVAPKTASNFVNGFQGFSSLAGGILEN